MGNRGKLKTRVFELAEARNMALPALAVAMGLDKSLVWRVKVGQRGINQAFITGAKRAFPNVDLGYLFYVDTGGDAPGAGETSEVQAAS